MRDAAECLLEADRAERKAADAKEAGAQSLLLKIASEWRRLAWELSGSDATPASSRKVRSDEGKS